MGSVRITIFDGNYDALTQSSQFDTMITQKYDAIIFVPIDLKAGAAPVKKAIQAGIPVIGSNTRVAGDVLTSYVGNDDVRFLDNLKTPTPDGTQISVIPAVAGG